MGFFFVNISVSLRGSVDGNKIREKHIFTLIRDVRRLIQKKNPGQTTVSDTVLQFVEVFLNQTLALLTHPNIQ